MNKTEERTISSITSKGRYVVFKLDEQLLPLYKKFGINLPEHNADESYELPMPATFVVSPDRTIQFAFVDADYTHRLEPKKFCQHFEKLFIRKLFLNYPTFSEKAATLSD